MPSVRKTRRKNPLDNKESKIYTEKYTRRVDMQLVLEEEKTKRSKHHVTTLTNDSWVPVNSIPACYGWHDNHAQQSTSTAVTVGCTIGTMLRKHSNVLLYSMDNLLRAKSCRVNSNISPVCTTNAYQNETEQSKIKGLDCMQIALFLCDRHS